VTEAVTHAQEPHLSFVEPIPSAYPPVLAELVGQGKRKVLLRGSPAEVRDSLEALKPHAFFRELSLYAAPESPELLHLPEITRTATAGEVDAVLVFASDPFELSNVLMGYRDLSTGRVYAPATRHKGTNRTVLVNSIPKSGTHLLFECAKAFGFRNPPSQDLPRADDDLVPGHFYNLQHMTLNRLAIPFFQSPDFINAFSSSVVLFIYRDPRDVAVSMAHYLASQTDYHMLRQYMRALDPADRLSTVIEGTYPLPVYLNRQTKFRGTIRDLVLRYIDWVQSPLPNCVPVRYEDLVGTQGGGDALSQSRALWILQLALQVPGSPSAFAGQIYNRSTVTFREGRIGGYRREFTSRHHAQLAALGGDFLDSLGYGDNGGTDRAVQARSATFDRFHGAIPIVTDHHPRLLVEDWMGFNIVLFEGRYYALARSLGEIDLTHVDLERLRQDPGCIVGSRLREVKASIAALVGRSAELDSANAEASQALEELAHDVGERADLQGAELQRASRAAHALIEQLRREVESTAVRFAQELAEVRRDLKDHDEKLRTGIDRVRQELDELRAARLFRFGPRLARFVRTPRPR